MKTLAPDVMREAAANAETVIVSGMVDSISETSAGYQAVLSGCEIKSDQATASGFRIRLTGLSEEICPGTYLEAEGEASGFETAENDGGFDEAAWMASEDVVCQIRRPKIRKSRSPESILYTFSWHLKKRLKDVFISVCPDKDDAGVFLSLLTGDRSGIDPDLKKLWQKAGIAHLLAISGLHITFAASLARGLAGALGASPYLSCAVGGSVAAYFCFFTGNGISARRALIMYLLLLFARLTGRTYDRISALSFAFILITADRCGASGSSSLILSFSAIGGLAFLYPALHTIVSKCKSWLLRGLLDAAAAALSTFLAMIPAESWLFYEIPFCSFFLNLLIIPLSSLLLLSVFLTGASGLFFLPAGRFFCASGAFLLRLFSILGENSLKVPGSVFITGRPSFAWLAVYFTLLAAGTLLLQAEADKFSRRRKSRERRAHRLGFLSFALSLALVFILALPKRPSSSALYMLDVGQGDCLVLQTNDGKVWVIDCGSTSVGNAGEKRLAPFLKYHGFSRIEGIFVTHGDADHINGVQQLLEEGEFTVARLCLSDIKNRSEAENMAGETAESQNIPVISLSSGGKIIGKGYTFSILAPEKGEEKEDRNEESLVMRYEESGFSVLFMGDAGAQTEEQLLSEGEIHKATVLKTGHHGSKSASTPGFLAAVSPKVALISCGKNNRYGHPAAQTLENMEKAGIPWLVTKDTGQLTVRHEKGLVVHLKVKES